MRRGGKLVVTDWAPRERFVAPALRGLTSSDNTWELVAAFPCWICFWGDFFLLALISGFCMLKKLGKEKGVWSHFLW